MLELKNHVIYINLRNVRDGRINLIGHKLFVEELILEQLFAGKLSNCSLRLESANRMQ